VANFIGLLIAVGSFAGWCQHLYTCFNEKLWGFLVAGALFCPDRHHTRLGHLAGVVPLRFTCVK
jgi:hypothetical protein